MDHKKPVISESLIKKHNTLLLIKKIFAGDRRINDKVAKLRINTDSLIKSSMNKDQNTEAKDKEMVSNEEEKEE